MIVLEEKLCNLIFKSEKVWLYNKSEVLNLTKKQRVNKRTTKWIVNN